MREYNTAVLHAVVLFTICICLCGFAVLFSALLVTNQRRAQLMEKKEMEESFREELVAAVLEMQENTFRSITRDIHDNAAQLLSLAKLNLHGLSLEADSNTRLGVVKELMSKAMDALRDIGHTDRADSLLDSGLVEGFD